MKQTNQILSLLATIIFSLQVYAQFFSVSHTTRKGETYSSDTPQLIVCEVINRCEKAISNTQKPLLAKVDTLAEKSSTVKNEPNLRGPKFHDTATKSPSVPGVNRAFHRLPLTYANLCLALRYYHVQHPRIVLAQAILETGWLRSPVCRTKNNLFGLTNPRTGEYYEFEHWSDSVRGYKTLVQYRYKGGNYYDWLDEIGYAEAPDYTTALKKVVAHHL